MTRITRQIIYCTHSYEAPVDNSVSCPLKELLCLDKDLIIIIICTV